MEFLTREVFQQKVDFTSLNTPKQFNAILKHIPINLQGHAHKAPA